MNAQNSIFSFDFKRMHKPLFFIFIFFKMYFQNSSVIACSMDAFEDV